MRPSFPKKIVGAFVQLLEAFSFVMRNIVGWPLKVSRSSFTRAVNQAKNPALDANNQRKKRSWASWFFLPFIETSRFLYRLIVSVVSFPYRFIKHLLTHTKSEFLWCLPAMLALFLLVLVVARVFSQNQQIQGRYRGGLAKSMRAGDFELGKTYCQRLVTWGGETYESDRFNLAVCLLQTGEANTGIQILNELAPNDTAGYPAAHRFKAILLSDQLSRGKRPESLDQLIFHLTNSSDQNSQAIQAAYGTYYMLSKQPQRAINYLELAAKKNPLFYLEIADIYESTGAKTKRISALRNAESGLDALLQKDPANHEIRIQKAAALNKLGLREQAKQELERGRLLRRDSQINRALADFHVMIYDQTPNSEEKLALLQSALNYDINFLPIYQRLITQFRDQSSASPEQRAKIELLLNESIADGKSTAIAHFAISNLKSLEGKKEDAIWHIERAFALDPQFGFVSNNLAFMLSNETDEGDLDRAYDLAVNTTKKFPENADFRHTLGSILIKKGQFDDALGQLEPLIDKFRAQKKRTIHEELSFIYQNLGKPELSQAHNQRAKNLAQSPQNKK